MINKHTWWESLLSHFLLNSIYKTKCVVTAEEHQISGGLGESISQLLALNNPTPMEFVAVNDSFGESGKPEELMEKYGLGTQNIIDAVKKVLKRK